MSFGVILNIFLICPSKMVPSVDPLNFKLYLGYLDYPTDTNFVAMTEMPLKGTTEGDESLCFLLGCFLNGNSMKI